MPENESNSPMRRPELAELGRRCLLEWDGLAGRWSQAQAEVLHEHLEMLADLSGNFNDLALYDCALEFAVYLSSFADSPNSPVGRQHSELVALGARLEAVVVGQRQTEPDANAKLVYYLCQEPQPDSTLNAALAQFGLVLKRLADGDRFVEALAQQPPLAIIVDASLVSEMIELVEKWDQDDPRAARVPIMALAERGNSSERLRATLAGADVFVEPTSTAALAKQIYELTLPATQDPYRVLVIDDDAQIGMFCRGVLARRAIQVETLTDGAGALEAIERFKPDLLLMDLNMPGMNGMELTAQIREQAGAMVLPIVFLSGETDEQARFDAISAGGDDYLVKPIRPRFLLTAVTSRIRRVRALKARISATEKDQPSTGLLRRAVFLERLKPTDNELSLVSLLIDQGEQLKSKLGMVGQSDLEQAIGARLSAELTVGESASVWQEFGFGLLLKSADTEVLQARAERLRTAVSAKPFRVAGSETKLTVSIGVAIDPSLRGDTERWINATHGASLLAHRLGGDRVEGLGGDLPVGMSAERAADIRAILQRGVERDAVLLEFQPLVQMRGPLQGQYELKLLLKDRRAPLVGVQRREYWPLARQAGKTSELDQLALTLALETLSEQHRSERALRLLTPLSAAKLSGNTLEFLARELERRSLPGYSLALIFDAVELTPMQRELRPYFEHLRRLGVRALLSHEGADLEPLVPLENYPWDGYFLNQTLFQPREPGNKSVEDFTRMLKRSREKGRALMVSQLSDAQLLAQLWSTGVDYLSGDFICPAGARLDYAFDEIRF